MPDHRSLRPRDRDRQRVTLGRPELDNVSAVVLRAVDQNPVLSGGAYVARQSASSHSVFGFGEVRTMRTFLLEPIVVPHLIHSLAR